MVLSSVDGHGDVQPHSKLPRRDCAASWINGESKMHTYRSINDIIKEDLSRCGIARLIGKTADRRKSNTFIVPCFYDPINDKWLCIDRHHNGNKKHLGVCLRAGSSEFYRYTGKQYYLTDICKEYRHALDRATRSQFVGNSSCMANATSDQIIFRFAQCSEEKFVKSIER